VPRYSETTYEVHWLDGSNDPQYFDGANAKDMALRTAREAKSNGDEVEVVRFVHTWVDKAAAGSLAPIDTKESVIRFSHNIALPKGKRRLNIDEATAALAQMGYRLGNVRYDPAAGGSVYKVTQPNGSVVDMPAAKLTDFIYQKAQHMRKQLNSLPVPTIANPLNHAEHGAAALAAINAAIKSGNGSEAHRLFNLYAHTLSSGEKSAAWASIRKMVGIGANYSRKGAKAAFARWEETQTKKHGEPITEYTAKIGRDHWKIDSMPSVGDNYGALFRWDDLRGLRQISAGPIADLKRQAEEISRRGNDAIGNLLRGFSRDGAKAAFGRSLIASKGSKRVYLNGPDGNGKFNLFLVQVARTGIGDETEEDLIEMKSFATEARARSAAQKMLSSRTGAKAKFAQIDPSVSGVRIDPYTTKVPLILNDGRRVTAVRTNGQWGIVEMPDIAPRFARDIYAFVERLNRNGFSRTGEKAKFGNADALLGLAEGYVADGDDEAGLILTDLVQMKNRGLLSADQAKQLSALIRDARAMGVFSRTGAKAAFATAGQVADMFKTLSDVERASIKGDTAKMQSLLKSLAPMVERDRAKLPKDAVAYYDEMRRKAGMSRTGAKANMGVSRVTPTTKTESGGGTWTTKTASYGGKKATVEFYNKNGLVGSVYQDPDNPTQYKAFDESSGSEIASGSRASCKAAVEKIAMSRTGAKAKFSEWTSADDREATEFLARANDLLKKCAAKQAQITEAATKVLPKAIFLLNKAMKERNLEFLDEAAAMVDQAERVRNSFSRTGAKSTHAAPKFKIGDKVAVTHSSLVGTIVGFEPASELGNVQSRGKYDNLENKYHLKDDNGQSLNWHSEGRLVRASRSSAKSTHAADDAVSAKIATLVREGYPQGQAAAIAYDMKRRGEL